MDELGFAVLPNVFSGAQVDAILEQLTRALADSAAIRGGQGTVVAARNVLSAWPAAGGVWRQSPLPDVLHTLLGRDYGLVRVLFFDKPPDQTWALPWHKDLTIAVRDNRLPSRHFHKPTTKAGVPHVEASQDVLEGIVTVRLHLDDVTEENGPLKVIPGSHQSGKLLGPGGTAPQSILTGRGDVLLMWPLLAHCSSRSHSGTRRHRRILHLEFAASAWLPDGYAWHDFVPGQC
jgi:ectoine hydroxylase-related dioxygenase (phytanoyl-CoA dioxygenase family)